jgi:hypothetical protein
MKTIFKIKWELVITVLLAIATIFSYSVYLEIKDYRLFIVSATSSVLLITMILGYNQVKIFRHEVLRLWQ